MRRVGELPAFTIAAILVSCTAIPYQIKVRSSMALCAVNQRPQVLGIGHKISIYYERYEFIIAKSEMSVAAWFLTNLQTIKVCLDASMALRPQNFLGPINERGGQHLGGGSDDETLFLPPAYNSGYGERAGALDPNFAAEELCREAIAAPPAQALPQGYPNLQGYNRYLLNGYAPPRDNYYYDKGDPSHFPRRPLLVGNEPVPSVHPFWTHIALPPQNSPYPIGLLNQDLQRKLINPRVPTRRYGVQPGAGDLQYHYDKGEPSIMKRPQYYVPGAING